MNIKRWLPVFLALMVLLACNLPSQSLPVFVAPSGAGSATPDWAATLQAAAPTEIGPAQQVEVTSQAEPINQPAITPAPTSPAISGGPLLYYSQAGDTLTALAVRFGVQVGEIESPDPIPATGFINPNQLLIIPNQLANTTSSAHLLPDSEVVYAFSGVDFDTQDFVTQAGGYLNGYHEYLSTNGETHGGELIELLALDNSINPRLLLALLEYQSGWVYGQPGNLAQRDYPMGQIDSEIRGLLRQMKWVVNQLSIGYYGWREGRLSQIQFRDGVSVRLAPDLNAGTAALQYYFAQVYDSHGWVQALDPENGFPALYASMFGNPWVRARAVEPLFPANLTQPELEFPFLIGTLWSYTGGPHGAWERDGSWAAIDFAPSSNQSGCVDSDAWVTASAPGLILRSERGIVV
ncbi:MAG: hypothetical protein JW862_19355, partial [Anaerolineales bacterium]|nr:hypothetical protein [Anaerolineales bacterium]